MSDNVNLLYMLFCLTKFDGAFIANFIKSVRYICIASMDFLKINNFLTAIF